MSRERWLYLRVGMLLVAALVLAGGMVWFIGGQRIGQAERVESYFSESVQGLEIGAPVKYRGVTLGRVTEIGLVSAAYAEQRHFAAVTSRLVYVRYVVDRDKVGRSPDIPDAVRLGLRVRLAAQGLTGISYLELDFVDPRQFPPLQVPWTPALPTIPSIPSTLSQVQDAAQQVLAKLSAVDVAGLAHDLAALVQDLHQQISEGDADQALRHVAALAQTLQDTVHAADLPGLSADMRQASTALRELAQGEQTRVLLDQAARAMTGLATAANRLPALIASLQATSRRANDATADAQRTLLPLLRDLQATARNLRETTDTLRRYPGQLLSAPPPRGSEHGP